jgi:Methyltransferase domain
MTSLAATVWAKPPLVHAGGDACFSLSLSALQWLESHVTAPMTTVETGCGASTVVFAASGARHTTIAPDEFEHEQLRAYCAAEQISTDKVTFLAEPSHVALPRLSEPLDLALVDGAHGFPYPVIDWFHTQARLNIGGYLLLDDCFIPTINAIIRYLRNSEAWEFVGVEGDRTTIFRKLSEELPPFHQWAGVEARVRFDYLPLRERVPAALKHSITEHVPYAREARRHLGRVRRARIGRA